MTDQVAIEVLPRRPHGPLPGIKAWWKRRMRRRGAKHIVAVIDRFNQRLGLQFAGALTYFSFLAVVPILMVAFSIAGFVLSSAPSLLTDLRTDIANALPKSLSATVTQLLDTAVDARYTVGIIGLVVALYSGVSWMGNLRSAIQAMWRPDFDEDQEIARENLFKYYLKSLRYLVTLGLAILLSVILTAAGSWAQDLVLHWLSLDQISWLTPFFTIGPILLAIGTDVLIFIWVYTQLAPKNLRAPRKHVVRGSIMAAVAFEVLKFGLTYILPLLLTSATAKLFGPIIGLLFFFNFAATVVLFVAAWIATGPNPRLAGTMPDDTLPLFELPD